MTDLRKLDALVAEKVMGWKPIVLEPGYICGHCIQAPCVCQPPLYSSDLNAAFEVVGKLISDGYYPDLVTSHDLQLDTVVWRCVLHHADIDDAPFWAVSRSLLEAICTAALKTVGKR